MPQNVDSMLHATLFHVWLAVAVNNSCWTATRPETAVRADGTKRPGTTSSAHLAKCLPPHTHMQMGRYVLYIV